VRYNILRVNQIHASQDARALREILLLFLSPAAQSRIMFYYAIMAARHTVQYTQIHPLKRHKKITTVKRNRTGKTRATLGLLYCAGECVPYTSLLYCLRADVSRRQTIG